MLDNLQLLFHSSITSAGVLGGAYWEVGSRQKAGSRRREVGSRGQEAGGRRRKAESKGSRQKVQSRTGAPQTYPLAHLLPSDRLWRSATLTEAGSKSAVVRMSQHFPPSPLEGEQSRRLTNCRLAWRATPRPAGRQ